MADINDLYQKLDAIREAIKNNSEPDGTCHFDIIEVAIALNLALSCISDAEE